MYNIPPLAAWLLCGLEEELQNVSKRPLLQLTLEAGAAKTFCKSFRLLQI